jgi:phenylpropionate dioxygenase-like ring-hydroxylating dioxygenase large terminal subunit
VNIANAPQIQASSLIAGGSDPDRFDPQEAWYPVYYLEDLDPHQPSAFTLMGRDLVIWWEPSSSTWRAMEDRCPHRLARLSEGRVNSQGELECPYHGWTFSGSGQCTHIPQQATTGQAEQSQRACLPSLPTAVAQGLLFVYAGSERELPPLPLIGPLAEEPEGWVIMNTFRDLPYDAFTLLENVLDASHLPYTHHNTVGNRSNAAPMELEVLSSGKTGFTGIWPEGPRKGKLGTQHTTFMAPALMWHDLTSKQFGRTITAVYATPIGPGQCRLFARFPFKFPPGNIIPSVFFKYTPQWYSHISQNRILEDDQIFLHHQERYLDASGGATNFKKAFYLPTKADLFVFEFREWADRYQVQLFPEKSLPPAQSKEQLLNRYSAHTVHCKSCSGALRNLEQLRSILAVLAFGGWAIGSLCAVSGLVAGLYGAIAVTGLSLWGRWQCKQFIQKLHQGDPLPPRNRLEKVKKPQSSTTTS